ncbi:MAG TPA: ATP-binding protein [Candidatus Angelobacter sp.]
MAQPTHPTKKRDALQVLAEASASLLATPDVSSVASKILDLASEVIQAEAYAVWRGYDQKAWKIIAARGLSPEYMEKTLPASGPSGLTSTPVVIEDVSSHPLVEMRRNSYRAEGIASLMVVPLLIQNRPEGTITFYWKTPHKTSAEDVQYASTLANLAASAINSAELYEERVNQARRSRFLAEASTLLASSLDYDETLKQVAKMAVPTIADWCSVRILENGQLARTAVAHNDPDKLALADEYSKLYPDDMRADRGLGRVLATGESELYPIITDEMLVQGAHDEKHLSLLRTLGMTSAIIVPLNARGRTLGALTLIAAESRHQFDAQDLEIAQDLARRAAIAVDNAQLYRALRESELQFRTLIEQSPVSTIIFDNEGHPVEGNAAFERLFGASLAEAPEDYSVFSDPQLLESGLLPAIRKAFAGENVFLPPTRYDTSLTSRNGKGNVFWAEGVMYPIRDAAERIARVVLMQTDVTGRIEAETKRAATEETLRRTEKLAAAGRLAATIAHEINNPLEAVTNILFLLRDDARIPAEFHDYLVSADHELQRVAHIVRQTLGFYRENVAAELADISAVVTDMLHLYRKRIDGKQLSLSLSLQECRATVVVGEIKQVVANILANAIDASPSGGKITVKVLGSENHVTITVEDTGTGIAPANAAHLFEPFFTTKESVGTGLGLWVSKQIVERHRGSITVENRGDVESGARVTVGLPLHA